MFLRFFLLFSLSIFLQAAPSVLYLTWVHDPTTTMTIQWHAAADAHAASKVFYRLKGEEEWFLQEGVSRRLYQSKLAVHTVELLDLSPGAEYEFCFDEREPPLSFRTLPQTLEKPLSFVVGGDAYFYLDTFKKMNATIAKHSPEFVVIGGDIAYTNGMRTFFRSRKWEIRRWRRFLKEWRKQLVTEEGRLIPLLPVLGNHDIRPISLKSCEQHPLFYELFALPEAKPYRALDCGDYLSLYLLDSGHSYHISGEQTEWLESALQARQEMPYRFAVYHIGAYPSVYSFNGAVPRQIRKHWSPLFERYGLQAAFEHHNHAYKRTYPMNGVVYLGDGSWGISPREPKELWYLEKSAKVNAVFLVTLEKECAKAEAITIKNKLLDYVTFKSNRADLSTNAPNCLGSSAR